MLDIEGYYQFSSRDNVLYSVEWFHPEIQMNRTIFLE